MSENLKRLGVSLKEQDLVFDGPNNKFKYNRLILRPEQIQLYGKLFGYKVNEVARKQLSDDVTNVYYLFEKDPDFKPQDIAYLDLRYGLFDLGFFNDNPNSDPQGKNEFNTIIENWGVTIGQALIYGLGNPADEGRSSVPVNYIRIQNQTNRSPQKPYGHGPATFTEKETDGSYRIDSESIPGAFKNKQRLQEFLKSTLGSRPEIIAKYKHLLDESPGEVKPGTEGGGDVRVVDDNTD
jgi:hypothetical protein